MAQCYFLTIANIIKGNSMVSNVEEGKGNIENFPQQNTRVRYMRDNKKDKYTKKTKSRPENDPPPHPSSSVNFIIENLVVNPPEMDHPEVNENDEWDADLIRTTDLKLVSEAGQGDEVGLIFKEVEKTSDVSRPLLSQTKTSDPVRETGPSFSHRGPFLSEVSESQTISNSVSSTPSFRSNLGITNRQIISEDELKMISEDELKSEASNPTFITSDSASITLGYERLTQNRTHNKAADIARFKEDTYKQLGLVKIDRNIRRFTRSSEKISDFIIANCKDINNLIEEGKKNGLNPSEIVDSLVEVLQRTLGNLLYSKRRNRSELAKIKAAKVVDHLLNKAIENVHDAEQKKYIEVMKLINKGIGSGKDNNVKEWENYVLNLQAKLLIDRSEVIRTLKGCKCDGDTSSTAMDIVLNRIVKKLNDSQFSNPNHSNTCEAAILLDDILKQILKAESATAKREDIDFLYQVRIFNIGNKPNAYQEWKAAIKDYLNGRCRSKLEIDTFIANSIPEAKDRIILIENLKLTTDERKIAVDAIMEGLVIKFNKVSMTTLRDMLNDLATPILSYIDKLENNRKMLLSMELNEYIKSCKLYLADLYRKFERLGDIENKAPFDLCRDFNIAVRLQKKNSYNSKGQFVLLEGELKDKLKQIESYLISEWQLTSQALLMDYLLIDTDNISKLRMKVFKTVDRNNKEVKGVSAIQDKLQYYDNVSSVFIAFRQTKLLDSIIEKYGEKGALERLNTLKSDLRQNRQHLIQLDVQLANLILKEKDVKDYLGKIDELKEKRDMLILEKWSEEREKMIQKEIQDLKNVISVLEQKIKNNKVLHSIYKEIEDNKEAHFRLEKAIKSNLKAICAIKADILSQWTKTENHSSTLELILTDKETTHKELEARKSQNKDNSNSNDLSILEYKSCITHIQPDLN